MFVTPNLENELKMNKDIYIKLRWTLLYSQTHACTHSHARTQREGGKEYLWGLISTEECIKIVSRARLVPTAPGGFNFWEHHSNTDSHKMYTLPSYVYYYNDRYALALLLGNNNWNRKFWNYDVEWQKISVLDFRDYVLPTMLNVMYLNNIRKKLIKSL